MLEHRPTLNQSNSSGVVMIYQNSSSVSSPSTRLISISEAATRFGLCQATLRRWDESGKITSYRVNCRGHRRFDPQGIARAMGQEVNSEKNVGRIPVCYCRTSSESQRQSLINQCTRARTEVAKLENLKEEDVVIYQECKSAFSSREKLNAMTEQIILGRISKVYVIWLDRLGRDGTLEIFKSICSTRGVEIVVLEQDECSDSEEVQAGLQECMNYLQVVINRRMGKRGGAKVKRNMDQKTLELCYSLYREGQSIRQIEARLKALKITDDKGVSFKRGVILARIKSNLKTLQAIHKDEPTNSFQDFCQKYVKKSRGHKKLARSSIVRAYQAYIAETPGVMSVSDSCITKTISKMYDVEKEYGGWRADRRVFYKGLVLTTNKGGK